MTYNYIYCPVVGYFVRRTEKKPLTFGARIASVLRWPLEKPLRAILFLGFAAAWPSMIESHALRHAIHHFIRWAL